MQRYEDYVKRLYQQTGQPGAQGLPWQKGQGQLGNAVKTAISPQAAPNGYERQLKAAQDQQLQARADAVQGYVKQFADQKNQVAQDARENRAQVYTDARLSAIGNNEAMAAQGLAGGLYGANRSGYSETSRVAQDMGLRSSLAGVDAAKMKAQQEIDSAINELLAQNKLEDAQLIRDNAAQLIELLMQQDQFNQQMQLSYAQLEEQKKARAESGGGSSGGGGSSRGGSSGGRDLSGYDYTLYQDVPEVPVYTGTTGGAGYSRGGNPPAPPAKQLDYTPVLTGTRDSAAATPTTNLQWLIDNGYVNTRRRMTT